MSENISTLQKRLKRAEELKSKAQGSLDTLLSALQHDYGVGSLEEAEAELDKARKLLKQKNKELETLQTKFNEDWADVLEGLDE